MKRTKNFSIIFLTGLMGMLISCPVNTADPDSTPKKASDTVTIKGSVTITRNGIPWNTDNFPDPYPRRYNQEYTGSTESLSRTVRPDRACFEAYMRGGGNTGKDHVFMGYVYPDDQQSDVDFANGTIKWTMQIPSDKLPCNLYFVLDRWMYDVVSLEHGVSPYKTTKGVWVIDENESIDFGHVDFDIIRLSGNLPVTINGVPFDYADTDSIQKAQIKICYSNPHTGVMADIAPNGDWSVNVVPLSSPIPLLFKIAAEKNGGIFEEALNPTDSITIYNTDKEVIFPSYPQGIDLKAVTLSGTVKLYAAKGQQLVYHLDLYEIIKDGVDFFGIWYAPVSQWEILIGSTTVYFADVQYDGDGLIVEWEMMLPASFPKKIPFRSWAATRNDGATFETRSNIEITEDTDLSNIYLGAFTLKKKR